MIGDRPSEEGAALLAVLLLVAAMAAISVMALEKLRLATHLAANGQALDQARAYALGAEAFALIRITDLGARDRAGARPLNWNGRVIRTPVPDGAITARLRDGGNCFNLNSVVTGLPATELKPRPEGMAQFTTLMRLLGVRDGDARRITAALADWIDSDSETAPYGAEDTAYADAAIPYRAADTLLAEPSELRAVAGVTPAIYALLRPWVCALPEADLSPINVNLLAPDQAVLVAMLLPGRLDLRTARAILAARPAGGWTDMSQFWRTPALAALTPTMEAQAQPRLRTRWFMLDLDVEVAHAQVNGVALIDGGLSPARVVQRRWGSDE